MAVVGLAHRAMRAIYRIPTSRSAWICQSRAMEEAAQLRRPPCQSEKMGASGVDLDVRLPENFRAGLAMGASMKSKQLAKIAGALFALTLAGQTANATIIDNTTYTTDTATGLDWLDVTASLARSFNNVSANFGSGGAFQGWRYATGAELTTLLLDWGITAVPHENNPASQLQLHTIIIQILGPTFVDPDQMYTFGLTADPAPAGRWAGLIWEFNGSQSLTAADPEWSGTSDATAFANVGSFLVRDTVAVPGPVVGAGLPGLLAGFGVMLAWYRKRRAAG